MSDLDFTGYASRIYLRFEEPQNGAELKKRFSEFMSQVAVGCIEAGATLVGHIKGILETENGEFVTCSVLTRDGNAQCRGDISGTSQSLSLVINVMIYGLEKGRVQEVVHKVAENEIHGKGVHFRMEEFVSSEAGETAFNEKGHPCHAHHH